MRALVALAVCVPSPAYADEDDALELTAVTATVAHTTAKLSVRYRSEVAGPTTSYRSVSLPARGVVTGATIDAGGERHALELLPTIRAEQRFTTLADARPGRRRAWAIRIHGANDNATSIDLAVPRPVTLAIELAITAPTCFVRDWRYVAVPESWLAVAPAAWRVPPALVAEVTRQCGDHDMPWLRFASRELASRPGGIDRIGAIASQLDLGDRHVAKLEVALAAQLTDVPRDLATAIVVDASRSMSRDELEAQRALVASYVAAAGGRVQMIAMARTARPLLPGWMSAHHAAPRIARELGGLTVANGSNVEAALREAVAWLRRVNGTRRIMLVTDERLPSRLENVAKLQASLGRDILMNVAVVGEAVELERDDETVLAPLAKATRGIAVRGAGDATILARPISVDHVTIATPGWTEVHADRTGPFTFEEGSSRTWIGTTTSSPQPITISGLLWNTPVTQVVRPDASRGRELARELAASSQIEDEALQARVELASLAVSGQWSLFATWGGSGGYADAPSGGGYGSISTCACGGGGGLGHGRGTGSMFGPAEDLQPQLARAIASCQPDRAVTVTLETTFSEIVDVAVEVAPAADSLKRCVEEAVWNTWLVMARPVPRARWAIRVH